MSSLPPAPLALLLACAPLSAQAFVLPASQQPSKADLPGANPMPLMHAATRVQQFYEVSEIGSARFTARRLAFRFDGPTGGRAARHSVAKLTLRLGVTSQSVAQLGSDFARNLTQPLVTAWSARRFDFVSDGIKTARAQPFGGPGSALLLPLPRPVLVHLPAGGCFALELVTVGNSNKGIDVAALDFFIDPGNLVRQGAARPNGRGCPAGPAQPRATMLTDGRYEPGGAFTIYGSGYAPRVPVVTLLTVKLFHEPLALPGTTPVCWIYVDPATGIPLVTGTTNGGGSLQAFGGENTIPIPKGPKTCGAVLYVQNVTPGKPWSGNSIGINSSNYRTIVVGCPKRPQARAWHAAHRSRADARIASDALYGGFALRID